MKRTRLNRAGADSSPPKEINNKKPPWLLASPVSQCCVLHCNNRNISRFFKLNSTLMKKPADRFIDPDPLRKVPWRYSS